MNLQDLLAFSKELHDIVDSIEWLMEPGDHAGNYRSQCAIDRIKSSEYWIDDERDGHDC